VTVEKLVGSVVAGGEPRVVDEGQALGGQRLGQLNGSLHVLGVAGPSRERLDVNVHGRDLDNLDVRVSGRDGVGPHGVGQHEVHGEVGRAVGALAVLNSRQDWGSHRDLLVCSVLPVDVVEERHEHVVVDVVAGGALLVDRRPFCSIVTAHFVVICLLHDGEHGAV